MYGKTHQPRIHLTSLGCAKNLVDSERILARLARAGGLVGAPPEEADVIIVNTCGFIEPAKKESIETILTLAKLKKTGPCRRLIVMGCLAQRYAAQLRRALPEADGIFGLDHDARIVAACGLDPKPPERHGRLLLTPKHTAYLRIAEGCDNRCAYCAIPMIRGPFRSRPFKEIMREARQLVARGVRELNLIAQDTSLYGVDLYRRPRLHELLARLAAIPELRWLRLLYTHPAHFGDDLIAAYASIEKLCPYADLPLQHLNDRLLQRMGRKVTQRQALDLIGRLRERVPGIRIRTTFLVGFPGETRAEFNEMLALVKRLRFDHLGAFAYSREDGTPAARMRGHVSPRAASRRLRDLMLAQQKIALEKNDALRGRVIEAVIESPVAGAKNLWVARSRFQAPDVDSVTLVAAPGLKPGRFLNVRIVGHDGYDLLARPAPSKTTRPA